MAKFAELSAAHVRLNLDDEFQARLDSRERAALIGLSRNPDLVLELALDLRAPLPVDALRADPYVCAEVQQGFRVSDPYDAVKMRDIAAAVFGVRKTTSSRADFCTWNLFQLPHNTQKLYMAESEAVEALQRWGEQPGATVAHPARGGAWTAPQLHGLQRAINELWDNASPLCRKVAEDAMDVDDGLDAVQSAAVATILSCPATVLTGIGGAGKTFCVSAAVRAVLSATSLPVAVLAPTHKAKYNLLDGLRQDLPLHGDRVTIATMQSHTQTLRKVKGRAPPAFVFIDEASMLDVESFGEFAKSVVSKCSAWQLCLVGDECQLPPVGRGECFRSATRQLRKSPQLMKLVKCYRAEFRPMFDFHVAVRDGSLPAGDGDVAAVITLPDDPAVVARVKRIIADEGAGTVYIAWQNDHVDMINRLVQQQATGTPKAGTRYNVGDRVVYCGENAPGGGLTNAMCGAVARTDSRVLSVTWDTGAAIPVATRDVRLAYCLTVHKAQGSGFDSVCVVCLAGSAMLRLIDRRWLYTAVSRARKRVRVVCTKEVAELARRPVAPVTLSSLRFAGSA